MKDLHIKAESFQDIWTISALAAQERFRIVLSDGQRRVNAKSLLGIFSMNLSRPLMLQLDCGDEEFERFREKVVRFEI